MQDFGGDYGDLVWKWNKEVEIRHGLDVSKNKDASGGMTFPKTAALLKKHYEAKDTSFNRINTMAPIRSQVAILNAQYIGGLPMSPDLLTVSQEQVVLQNPLPSAGPSLIPTASPQQRVRKAMEGMIGVPAQTVFHSHRCTRGAAATEHCVRR